MDDIIKPTSTPPAMSNDTASTPPEPTPQPPIQKPAPKPGATKGVKWLAIWSLVLLLAAGGFAYAWWQSNSKSETEKPVSTEQAPATETQTETAAKCEDGETNYESTQLGIGFCYPTVWGAPTATDDKLAAADTGSRFRIEFASKPDVKVAVVSTDWSTTVGRGGECYFPSNEAPDFAGYSTAWQTEGEASAPNFVGRGLSTDSMKYLVSEDASEFFGGVCIKGTVIVNTTTYPKATSSYFTQFAGAVTTPKQHMDTPTVLVSDADRNLFVAFTKTIHKL